MTHRWTSEEHVLDYLLGSIRAGVARDRALTISRNGTPTRSDPHPGRA